MYFNKQTDNIRVNKRLIKQYSCFLVNNIYVPIFIKGENSNDKIKSRFAETFAFKWIIAKKKKEKKKKKKQDASAFCTMRIQGNF